MSYIFLKKKNNSRSKLSADISGTDTAILVDSLVSFPESPEFLCTIWDNVTNPDPTDDPNMEIVKVTTISSGNTFIVTRAQEGTLARKHNAKQAIEHLITAGCIQELEEQINKRLDTSYYVEKSADYTLSSNDYLINCIANSFTITLPTAIGKLGITYNIKNSNAGIITFRTIGDQKIDTFNSGELLLQRGDNLNIQSNNSNWIIL